MSSNKRSGGKPHEFTTASPGKGKKRVRSDVDKEEPTDHPVQPRLSVGKKSKFVQLTVDMFDGDVSHWFETLHEHADPELSKLERGTLEKKLSYVQAPIWNVVKKFTPKKDQLPNKGEGPAALVVSASADRCCVVDKTIRKFPGTHVKLFARHMKVSEQKEILDTNAVGIAVGTPNRLLKLCEDSILKLDHLKVLVIDLVQDSKTFTVLDMPEVCKDFFKFFRQFVNNLSQDLKVIVVVPPPSPPKDNTGQRNASNGSKEVDASQKAKANDQQRQNQKLKKKSQRKGEETFVIKFKDEIADSGESTTKADGNDPDDTEKDGQ